ncbi:hypothetical protein [Paraburkholderia sp. BL10I2N1]|uniref:hypothetical protein n=1 Tax=Paraburkholderia sp. BL10I2N1 TaxID=1938796 RepID=UPI00105EF59F|nr:hypothetical protein [Paraburkholderia sp. BL10I2N1]TDN61316.1 hypothetical protein B0G77_4767 [Paraburkholderia sp. BL10I2N1]
MTIRSVYRAIGFVVIVLLACVAPDAQAVSRSLAPADVCTQYIADWSDVEKYVWTDVCRHGEADAGLAPFARKGDIPPMPISGDFVRTLLTLSPYRERVAEKGLRIHGFQMNSPLVLHNLTVHGLLDFQYFTADWIDMSFATIDGPIQLVRGLVKSITLDRAHITFDLTMIDVYTRWSNDCSLGSIDASGVEIDDGVQIIGGRFGKLNFSEAKFGRRFGIENAKSNAISLYGATVNGPVRLTNLV